MTTGLHVRPMTGADWPAVRAIYAAGIATGNAIFETSPPTWDQFDAALDFHGTVPDAAAAIGVLVVLAGSMSALAAAQPVLPTVGETS